MKSLFLYRLARGLGLQTVKAKPAGGRMSEASRSHLLGPVMSIAMVVGLIIGAGIFLLPASIASYGPNMFAGWALTIGGFLCLAFTFAL